MSVVPVPPQASEPVPPAPAGGEDLLGVRIGAALIDLALLFGLLVVLSATIRSDLEKWARVAQKAGIRTE